MESKFCQNGGEKSQIKAKFCQACGNPKKNMEVKEMYKKLGILAIAGMLLLTMGFADGIAAHSKNEAIGKYPGGPVTDQVNSPAPIFGEEPQGLMNYTIVAVNLMARPSYLVTETGQQMPITWIDNTGYVDGNPALALQQGMIPGKVITDWGEDDLQREQDGWRARRI